MSDLYKKAFEKALRALETARKPQDHGVATWLGQRLVDVPKDSRRLFIANSERYRTPEVTSWLVQYSDSLRFDDPGLVIDVASTAVAIAESLDDTPTPGLAEDHRAEAWAALGNAQRILGDLLAAEASFGRAFQYLMNGTGDPLLLALFQRWKGGLEVDKGNLEGALTLYHRAFRIYMELTEYHHAGRTLARMGIALTYHGQHEEAADCLILSLRLVDVEFEPAILISIAHSLAYLLAQDSEPGYARRLIRATYPLYKAVPGRLALVRLAWMEGRVLAASGLQDEAEQRLSAVHEDLHRRGMAYDAALAGLDLAGVYLETRQFDKVTAVAQEMHATFVSQGLGDRAAAALLLLVTAVREQRLTREIIAQAAGRVKEARRERLARF